MIFSRFSEIIYDKFQRIFWEIVAVKLYKKWGKSSSDYGILSMLIDKYKPASILDIGCGSGRLFKLFQEKNIADIVGVDISKQALKLANKAFPDIKTMRIRLEDMDFRGRRFDLAVSNRVLQHIPRGNIELVIRKICSSGNLVYVNELTESDGVPENRYTFKHDYERIFGNNDFVLIEKGNINNQTFLLFRRKETNNSSPY